MKELIKWVPMMLLGLAAIIIIVTNDYSKTSYSSSSSTPETKANVVQEQYDHYTREFGTMQSCLEFMSNKAQSTGMVLEISGDKPEKVSGSFNGDAALFFYCQRKETGTSGIVYEAAYPEIN